MLVGYMRVSSADDRQSVDLQRDALAAAGVDARHLHHDKGSTQHSRRQPQSSGSGRARVSSTICVDPSNVLRAHPEISESGSMRLSRSRIPVA